MATSSSQTRNDSVSVAASGPHTLPKRSGRATPRPIPSEPHHSSQHSGNMTLWMVIGVIAVVGGGIYWATHEAQAKSKPEAPKEVDFTAKPWNGRVHVTEKAQTAIGMAFTKVQKQVDPIRLPLLGTTKHDETKITKISPMFRGRVEKVHVAVGQAVEPGAPLMDIYSTELAQAKTAYEIEHTQWLHEKHLLEVRTELRKSNAISEQLLLDTQNDELRARHEYQVEREKLLVFGLTDVEIDSLSKEEGAQRARLKMRSPAKGVIILRDVVAGNLYNDNDVLLVIAPEDHLWVWGNVFERDLGLVHLGQKWDVNFSFLEDRLHGEVEYISPSVDPLTHAIKIRTSIANPDGHLKSDMLVRGALQIPPRPGYTVIPRTSMVVVDGSSYAFVRDPASPEYFIRHRLRVAHERDDHVVVESGLTEGEEVAVIGSLILEQLHEELETLETGRASGFNGDRD